MWHLDKETQTWNHKPWWKIWINQFLRTFQSGPIKWVVYTKTDAYRIPPRVLGYGLGPIKHIKEDQ